MTLSLSYKKYRIHQIKEESMEEEEAVGDVLENALRCQYDLIEDPRYFVMQSIHLNNGKLWKTLWGSSPKMKNLQKSLQNKTSSSSKMVADYKLNSFENEIIQSKRRFLQNYCKLFPYQVVKIVRLELRAFRNMLKENSRNVKIILLPRDPRDVYNSRRKLLWCQQNKDCSDIESFCNVMNSNYKSFKSMVKVFPDQLR